MRSLGDRIRRERVMWGMTQDELSEASGIARDKIAKIETGRRGVDAEELGVFARIFQLTVDALVSEPRAVVYHRIDASKPEAAEAKAWLDRCIDNSLFVRRLVAN